MLIALVMMTLQNNPPIKPVVIYDPVYSQTEDMSRTIEGLCRSRPFRVHRAAGSPTISVTIDGEPQQFDQPDRITAAIRSGSIGLADFYCTGDTFMVVILQFRGPPLSAYGKIRLRSSTPVRRAPQ